MTWHTDTMLSFDVETTGIDAFADRLVTVALVEVNATTGQTDTQHWILDPGIPIPDEAAQIHGWTTERVQTEGVKPETVLNAIGGQIRAHLDKGLPLIAYNASFDLSFLNAELVRHDFAPLIDPRPVIDPFVIDKGIDKYRRGKRTLTACADHYRVSLDGAHDAAADAICAARIAWRLGQLEPVAALGLDGLHDQQVVWAKEQADSLRSYFESKGKPTDGIDGSWPLRT